MIRDVNGCSEGYCFVDFRSELEAKRLLAKENIVSKCKGPRVPTVNYSKFPQFRTVSSHSKLR